MKRALIPSLISAAMTALAFAVPSMAFLMWFSLLPFFYALFFIVKTKKQAFFASFLFGLVYYLLLISWFWHLHPLTNVGIEGAKSLLLIFAAWVSVSVIMAFGIAAACTVFKALRPSPVLIAALWTLLEYLQSLGKFGFTWGRFSVSQYVYPLLIKSVSLFGSLFLTFVIVLFSALSAIALHGIKRQKSAKKYALIALSVFCFNIVLGLCAPKLQETGALTATMVWEDIAQNEKLSGVSTQGTYRQLVSLTREHGEGSDIVLWTETCIPVTIKEGGFYARETKALSEECGAAVIIGGFSYADSLYYSSMTAYYPDTDQTEAFYKRHLVPFGEFIPFRGIIERFYPELEAVNPRSQEINPWQGDCVISTPKGRLGGLICFDSTFPALAGKSVLAGAQILAVPTNDSWFSDTAAHQHMGHSVMRAVENGRYVLRSSNLGVSCAISPEGRLIAEEREGVLALTASVGLIDDTTLYTKSGDIILLPALLTLIFHIIKKYTKEQHDAK